MKDVFHNEVIKLHKEHETIQFEESEINAAYTRNRCNIFFHFHLKGNNKISIKEFFERKNFSDEEENILENFMEQKLRSEFLRRISNSSITFSPKAFIGLCIPPTVRENNPKANALYLNNIKEILHKKKKYA